MSIVNICLFWAINYVKDTHINFGEGLDPIDWDEAEAWCSKADLVIIAGTSMSLRHITHMPFLAPKVAMINLQVAYYLSIVPSPILKEWNSSMVFVICE
jgi:NAD-dependent SIR2 family protein deacetylase